ncbi:pyridoxal-phosphate dependent enzyme [Actinomadura sp. GC306]|uniref:threonine ammonia-lyase n=1 Tax=Actinomadura sp. GC306 TaxID=2530367 RepID=UPI00104C548C|nr:pyridoxal-phosphate dependent enzyme [Actinomadura sp. GC306]TDC70783.1 pyridoxal-phosphate dependent enzyme [Actinomadura sp. GC306]
MTEPLQVQRIEEATALIEPVFRNTPQYVDPALARQVGTDLSVKLETFNPIRSFKGRGADYFMRGLSAGQRVLCASAGNFGQAIAYAGRARGIPVTVFCARNANPTKVAAMRALGAEIVQTGDDFDAAKDAARAYSANDEGWLFVEDGREPRICEGAGTIAIELAALHPDLVLVPVGNGALVCGIGCWMKARSPATQVVGVCAAGAPAMAESWRRGTPVSSPEARTIADGVAVRVPVPEAVAWMRAYVDDVVLVDEDQIRAGLRAAQDMLGLLLEPAGALAIAAALTHRFPAERPAAVITGSNY